MPNILKPDEVLKVNVENTRFNYKGSVKIDSINVHHDGVLYCKYKSASVSKIDECRLFGPQIGFPSEEADVDLDDFGWKVLLRDPDVIEAISARVGGGIKIEPTSVYSDKRYLRYCESGSGSQFEWEDGAAGDLAFAALRVHLQLETAYLYGQHDPIRW